MHDIRSAAAQLKKKYEKKEEELKHIHKTVYQTIARIYKKPEHAVMRYIKSVAVKKDMVIIETTNKTIANEIMFIKKKIEDELPGNEIKIL